MAAEPRSAATNQDWLYAGSDPLLDEPKFFCARCLKLFVVADAYHAHYKANKCEEIESNGR